MPTLSLQATVSDNVGDGMLAVWSSMDRWLLIFSLVFSLVTMSFPGLAKGFILWLAALVARGAGLVILLWVG